jgi:hypothetical protein
MLQRSWFELVYPAQITILIIGKEHSSLEVEKEDGTLLANRDLSVQRPAACQPLPFGALMTVCRIEACVLSIGMARRCVRNSPIPIPPCLNMLDTSHS